MAIGRPSEYSEEIASKICGQLSEGISLRTVCRPDDMPSTGTIYNWFKQYPSFLEQYARAKEESADALVEDMLDIADDGTNDWMEKLGDDGEVEGWRANGENVQRSKLRVDTRKWAASKLKPKKYGDKIGVETTGEVKQYVISTQPLDAAEWERIYSMEAAGGATEGSD